MVSHFVDSFTVGNLEWNVEPFFGLSYDSCTGITGRLSAVRDLFSPFSQKQKVLQ
jgi:hypothetical protein